MTITHGGRRALPRQRTATTLVSAREHATARPAGVAGPRIRLGWQVAIVATAVAAYFLVRGATEAAYGEALRHAHALVDLERALGIYQEPALQRALAGSPGIRAVLNAIYIYGHWPVIVVTLLYLARRHPAIYLRARNTMLISGGIGLVVFISFPVAPPRLAALGMTDTVSVASEAYRVLQPHMFTNQYAAMPSLHVGWDLVIGLALAAAAGAGGRRGARVVALRVAALAMPAAMVVAVVLTANHYLLDAVAGAALTSVCWVAIGRYARRTRPATIAVPRPATIAVPRPATGTLASTLTSTVPRPATRPATRLAAGPATGAAAGPAPATSRRA